MSTVWQIDIEKNFNFEYWTNVYYCTANSTLEAQTCAQSIVNIEKACHGTQVNFDKYRVRNTAVVGAHGTVTALNSNGLVTKTGPLPLFCVARVDLDVPDGRPSRKYLRLPIVASELTSGVFTAAFQTALNTQYLTPIIAVLNICDESGQAFSSATVFPNLAMRQLRRGSKRKLPVL